MNKERLNEQLELEQLLNDPDIKEKLEAEFKHSTSKRIQKQKNESEKKDTTLLCGTRSGKGISKVMNVLTNINHDIWEDYVYV